MKKQHLWLVGTVLFVSALGWIFVFRKPNPDRLSYETFAREEMKAPVNDVRRIFALNRKVIANKGSMSVEDWQYATMWLRSTNMDMASAALRAIGSQNPSSPRRDQIINYAIKYLDNPNRAGTVTGIKVLHRFGDPRWQRYLSEYANSTDPESAKLGRQMQREYGVIP